jgi:hypothetical protein
MDATGSDIFQIGPYPLYELFERLIVAGDLLARPGGQRLLPTSGDQPPVNSQVGAVVILEPGVFQSTLGPSGSSVAAATASALKGNLTILFSAREATEPAADVLALHADAAGSLTSHAFETLVASPLMISNNRSSEGIVFDVLLLRGRYGCSWSQVVVVEDVASLTEPAQLVLAPLAERCEIAVVGFEEPV